ncbi:serine-rich adhesin for platelets-like isoform X2 [Branchiostoma floridae]|uniref:Serine-rich adhesin for platelets-like isoform X2 n=1 Tax=Branchiostoma floridae TaxID=7739 RepID=A0A9J7NCI7_BRAFL|nr:serine-rich adhesin for platelets-like isoform X2 [Branchiostoma floridae]
MTTKSTCVDMALGTPGSTVKVRRRLDFVKKPLEGESLYLDLPGYRNAKELEGDLKFLGARIETFLTRDISYVVTNRKEALTVRPDGGPSSPSPYLSPSPSPSPGGDEGPQGRRLSNVPLTRGQALLQKAQGRGRRGSCNMLSLAQEWGVKVLYVRDVTAKVQRLMEKHRLLAESEENAACPALNADVKPKRLRPPFIKVEDMSRLYRPLHHEFSSFPRIYFDADNDCPFDAPCHRLPSRPSCSLKLKPQTPATATKPDVQKGYCECCEVYYQEGLSLHLKGDKHQSFVRDSGNFVKLDSLLVTLPSLDEFFKKVVEENPQDEDMTAQEEQMSISPAVMEEITEKPRSSTEGSDDVFLLSDVGDEQAHVQSFQQPTNQVTDQKTERPNHEGDNITFNASNKPPKEEIRNDKKSNKDELFPVVVLSPMPNFRSSRQSGNSTSTQRRDSTFENRRCTSIRGEMKCDAVKEEQGLMTDKYNSNDEGDDQSHYRPEVISISSSSSFSIGASSSSHLSSSTSSYHSSDNETSSTSDSVVDSRTIAPSNDVTLNDVTLKVTNKDSQDIDVQDQHQSVHYHQKVRDEVQLQSVQVSNMITNGCQNSTDVTSNTNSFTESTSSSSEAGDLSSISSSSSSSSSSVRPNRRRRACSAVLESTSSSSYQDNSLSSPQTKISTIKGNCAVFSDTRDAKQHKMTTCCDPSAARERTRLQERSLATLGSTAAWAVAQSDDLALRLCKAKTGDMDEFVSPPDTDREWSVVERSGNLRVKLQRSSCRAKTPRSAHRASELQWSVHRSGDCKLTFSGSLRKQQRRPGMDSPQTDRNFGSRRKLKYL